MSQNVVNFHWSKKANLAAQLVFEDEFTNEEIAKKLGICSRQLDRWKANPEFQVRVKELKDQFGEAFFNHAYAKRSRRVMELEARCFKILRVIHERSRDKSMKGVPGGKTGLIVRQVKSIGKGEDFQVVEEYAVDVPLLRELRDTEKQIAQEVGQWTDKKEVTGNLSAKISMEKRITVLNKALANESDRELMAILTDRLGGFTLDLEPGNPGNEGLSGPLENGSPFEPPKPLSNGNGNGRH